MPKFHVSADGQARQCNAVTGPCPLTEEDGSPTPHADFANAKEASAFAEGVNAQRFGGSFSPSRDSLVNGYSKALFDTQLASDVLAEGNFSSDEDYTNWVSKREQAGVALVRAETRAREAGIDVTSIPASSSPISPAPSSTQNSSHPTPSDFDGPAMAAQARRDMASMSQGQIVAEARRIMARGEANLDYRYSAEDQEYLAAWDRINMDIRPLAGTPEDRAPSSPARSGLWSRMKTRVASPEAKAKREQLGRVVAQNTGPARIQPASLGRPVPSHLMAMGSRPTRRA